MAEKSRGGLRAVVIGAGFAGEGHTVALRHSGVDVVAICARQAEVVRADCGGGERDGVAGVRRG